MSKMISLIAIAAMLAIFSAGCSELGSPTEPAVISVIDFPAQGNGGGEQAAKPAAPRDLKAQKIGSKVKLSWQHTSLDRGWFRVYCAESADRGYMLIHTTQGLAFTDSPEPGFLKLKYRVTAVNSQGDESPFSEAVAVYGDDKGPPEEEVGKNDMDELI